MRPRSPEPVEGRKHIDVQTELYLEELSDRVEEADVEIQTDAFLDRPPSPMFVPAKTGKDIETQILEGDVRLLCSQNCRSFHMNQHTIKPAIRLVRPVKTLIRMHIRAF